MDIPKNSGDMKLRRILRMPIKLGKFQLAKSYYRIPFTYKWRSLYQSLAMSSVVWLVHQIAVI